MVRTNLTIMLREGFEGFPQFYAENAVHLVASLPCYLPTNVDKQRGLHVYERSIEVIRRLNEVGYATDRQLLLDLVYNPLGASLPPDQGKLEADYRRELDRRFGIKFSRLIAITNMPIGRFLRDLRREGQDECYLQTLRESFNPNTVERLMCRYQVHVSWDGTLHDCDFNYALRTGTTTARVRHIRDFDPRILVDREIATGPHCFGCTAGHGSSCGGELA
jgi:radical SAM/Cys-rich protein